MSELKKLSLHTKDIYEKNAVQFDEQRSKLLFEKKWLDIFLSYLDADDNVLDVGCGTGDPIGKYLLSKGVRLSGIDFSKKMIEIASNKFPHTEWSVCDMRRLNLNRKFKGIIAWNSFFHLTHEEQISTLNLFGMHLESKGVFMTTVGPEKGEVDGMVNHNRVYHSSLSLNEYSLILKESNMKVLKFVPNDPECAYHSILLCQKND